MSRLIFRVRLKTAAVGCLRLINSPSTRKDSSSSLFYSLLVSMKLPILRFVILAIILASLGSARDFRPAWHLENIPAGDSSIQQCYVFQTIPGVKYTVESTNDLSTWATQDELYGIGNEYVVTMREYTPPPLPPPGTPPSNPPALAANVSLRIQPASVAEGGSVVAWPSLDHGGPMIVRIAGEMDAAWNSIPIFSNRYAAYNFFFWHPGTPAAPPTENPPLGPKDTAMLAVLEASVPEINLQIAASIFQSRNAPLPAPPDPFSRKYWRVFCDWGIDTDEDGSPDWMEFEMAAQTTGSSTPPLRGDAFDADTNTNGIPDGEELDYDQDGVADAKDAGKDDASATFPIGPAPRYALFPITNAEPTTEWPFPIQINDKGTVLYTNGTWKAGKWTPLSLKVNGSIENASARGINDSDTILGIGYDHSESSHSDYFLGRLSCYWPTPTAQPLIVEKNDSGLIRSHFLDTTPDGVTATPFALNSGSILANDGGFYSQTYQLKEDRTGWIYKHHSRWKLPSGVQPASETPAGRGTRLSSDSSGYALRWGYDEALTHPKGLILFGVYSYPCPFAPTNVSVLPNKKEKQLLAMSMDKDVPAQVRYDNNWHTDTIYSQAIDISKDGIAIGKAPEGKSSSILINGKWTENDKYAPGLTGGWKTGISLLDTTPGGWVLAKQQSASGAAQFAALLSIRLNGVDPDYTPPTVEPGQPVPEPPDFFAGGVDHLTARAEGGKGYVPELWIMAPIAGSTAVRWRSPLNSASKLKPECGKAAFSPQEFTASAQNVTVSGNALVAEESDNVTDFPATLKLGALPEDAPLVTSLSQPVQVKRMKKRTVNLALHYVYSVNKNGVSALPFYQPTKPDLELYLNKVFGPQVNVNFVVSPPFIEGSATAGIDFDLDNDEKLETNIENERNAAMPNIQFGATGSNSNIDVWVFGGGVTLTAEQGFMDEGAYGIAFGGTSRILIDGNEARLQSIPAAKRMEHIYFTVAHEIGHVMTGGIPHPGETGYPWKLDWPTRTDLYLRQRLMCPGGKANHTSPGTALIKKEWDMIEEWLKKEEDEGRL